MSFSDVIRKEFKISDEERDRGLTTPDDVVRFDDICYVEMKGRRKTEVSDNDTAAYTDGDADNKVREDDDECISRWHYLDVYRPKSAGDDKLPVIVNVHGGGWVYGDKEVYQYYCMDLCRRGFAVVNFSYRLAPEFKFPIQLEDTNLAFTWVLNHANEYGFDTDRIYAVGDSAGANILALYSIICTNEEYAKKYDFKVPEQFVPRAVALNCGAYDVSINSRELKGFMKELMPDKGTDEELKLICVTRYMNKDFPASFIMTCHGDFLMEQAPVLEEKLQELGIDYESRLYGKETAPLKHVFHCDIRMEEAKVCNDETCEFFTKIG